MSDGGGPQAFEIGGVRVAPGERAGVDLPVSVLSNHTPMALAVEVVQGREAGPVFFLSAALHGDEVMGVEIIRRVLRHAALKRLKGTLLAVPVVNAFGFIAQSRYLPDRRDLNRSFPGSDHGSLASVLADLFLRQVVERAGYGIDLHSAGLHRTNLPQIRISPGESELEALAMAFGAPVVLVSPLRDGSLRKAAIERKVKVLVFEGGEALRFDEQAIRAGLAGILRVMRHLGMIEAEVPRASAPVLSRSSTWVRAPEGGIFRSAVRLGERVGRGTSVGAISDPFGRRETPVSASDDGIVIGLSNLPVVNRGDALLHIARVKPARGGGISQTPQFDEDEII
ncbi:MAG: succinylglutamate desuccinylase/aspartoacylase family protein [Parvibaculaceae bacterium]